MWRVDSLEKTLMLGGIGGRRRRGRQRIRWLGGIIDSMDTSLSELRRWWWTRRPGVLRFRGSQRVGHDWATELNWGMFHVYYVFLISTFSTFLKHADLQGKKKSASELSPEEWILHPHEPGLRWREEKAFQWEKAQETGKKTRRVCMRHIMYCISVEGQGKGRGGGKLSYWAPALSTRDWKGLKLKMSLTP